MSKGKELRIVFMGTPDFAVASLDRLVSMGYNVLAVVTAPDKPAGRGRKIQQPAVKKYAVEKNIPVLQPVKLKDPDFIKELKEFHADLQVVVAFRMLPELVWNMPPLGTFNLHASLLPQYRGAAPLNWAIINGETKTGVTTFLLQHEIDTGNIIFQEEVSIGSDDNVAVLHDSLMNLGAVLVTKTVDALAEGSVKKIDQNTLMGDESEMKMAPKIFKEDCLIDWNKPATEIKNLIRGLSPYPGAWTHLNAGNSAKTNMKIFAVEKEIEEHDENPGTIQSDLQGCMKIAANDGWINIKELQLAGKKRMNIEDFLRGFQQINDYRAG